MRILPVYGAFLAALAVLTLFTPLTWGGCQVWTAVTFTKNFGCSAWIDGHLWSLSVEEQFYALWPAILAFLPVAARSRIAIALGLAGPFFRAAFYATGFLDLQEFSFMTNMDPLMIGSALGLFVAERPAAASACFARRATRGRIFACLCIYVVWLLRLNAIGGWFTVPFGTTVQAAAAAYLIGSYSTHHFGIGFSILNTKAVATLGVLSYSLYIWQQPFFSNGSDFGGYRYVWLIFPLNVISAIGISAVSYYAIEKPLIGLRRRFRA